jgi:diamine N-acetyltransferase
MTARTVGLRHTSESDMDYVLDAEQQAARFVCQWDRDRHLEVAASIDWEHFIVHSASDERPVGFVILSGIADSDRNINLKRIVITNPGKGYGRAALRLILARVFDDHEAHRLWLDVRTYNERALRLYASEGFVREGLLRECDRVGDHYESVIIMSILEDEFKQRGNKGQDRPGSAT